MLAGMISKWTRVISEPPMVRLPDDQEAATGEMLDSQNIRERDFPLKLKNGSLVSKTCEVSRVSEGAFQIHLDRPASDIWMADCDGKHLHYVHSIDDYLNWVHETKKRSSGSTPIYRGHEFASYSIVSTFERFRNRFFRNQLGRVSTNMDDETELLTTVSLTIDINYKILAGTLIQEFVSLSKEPISSFDPIEWLVYARHSGLPVPVVDFTMNPLVALYFALRSVDPASTRNEDCVVYATYLSSRGITTPRDDKVVGNAKFGHASGKRVPLLNHSFSQSNASAIVDSILNLKVGAIMSPRSSSSSWLQKSVLVNLGNKSFYTQGFAMSHCFIRDEHRAHFLRDLAAIGIDETSVFETAEALAVSIQQRLALESLHDMLYNS